MAVDADPFRTPERQEVLVWTVLLLVWVGAFTTFTVQTPPAAFIYAALGGGVGALMVYVQYFTEIGQGLDFDERSSKCFVAVLLVSMLFGLIAGLWLPRWIEFVFLAVWFAVANSAVWRSTIAFVAVVRLGQYVPDVLFPDWIEFGFLTGALAVVFVLTVLLYFGRRGAEGGSGDTPQPG